MTAPRRSVLEWLGEHPHATVEQVRAGVAQALGSVSTQTVYDVLAACTAGFIARGPQDSATETLSLNDGANSASLHFNGSYSAANFNFVSLESR